MVLKTNIIIDKGIKIPKYDNKLIPVNSYFDGPTLSEYLKYRKMKKKLDEK